MTELSQSELEYVRTENRELNASLPMLLADDGDGDEANEAGDSDRLASLVSSAAAPVKVRLRALQALLSRTVADLTELSQSQRFHADYCRSLLAQIQTGASKIWGCSIRWLQK